MSTSHPLFTAALDDLNTLRSRPWNHALDVDAFESFLLANPGAILRNREDHLTVSVMVFTPELSHLLLCFHAKGGVWVQPGGHLEPSDDTLRQAAAREVVEESGVEDLTWVDDAPIDLTRYTSTATFGACVGHWDLTYAATAPARTPGVSQESKAVGWFPVSDLAQPQAHGFSDQVDRVLQRINQLS